MRILSKYKDYYDFYSGIYGIDNKIVLDRREGFVPYVSIQEQLVTLHINDFKYVGYSPEGKINVYFGEELKQFREPLKYKWQKYNPHYLHINRNNYYFKPQHSDLNKKHDCPIILESNGIEKYPQLSVYNFAKVIDPFNMWRLTSDWLARRITEKENTETSITDNDKARIHGMNPKTAFRPKMKNIK